MGVDEESVNTLKETGGRNVALFFCELILFRGEAESGG